MSFGVLGAGIFMIVEIFSLLEKECFTTGLVTQFLNYRRHLQLIVFICRECQWTSCMSCKVATHHIYNAIHYNSIVNQSKKIWSPNESYYATP
jgi:hypothetical protein